MNTVQNILDKLTETEGHQTDLIDARAKDIQRAAQDLDAATKNKQATEATVTADVATLNADKAELHQLIDATFPTDPTTPAVA